MKKTTLLLILFFVISLITNAQNWNQIIKTASSTRNADNMPFVKANARFGCSVAVDGTYAVIGISGDNGNDYNRDLKAYAGSVVVFRSYSPGQWQQTRKIVPNDRQVGDGFGVSVAISGTTIIVGSNGNKTDVNGANSIANAGAAYIFSENQGGLENWGQIKKLVPTDRSASTFGYSVAISGTNVVVGADLNETDANGANNITNAGAAYVFNRDFGGFNNWGQVKKIVANDRSTVNGFGVSVSISGINILIGTSGGFSTDESGANVITNAGAAYIFSRDFGGTNNWGQVKKIVANDRGYFNFFGSSVSISGNIVVIGAYLNTTNALGSVSFSNAGAAYIFDKDQGGIGNWGQVKKIVANDRNIDHYFGTSVTISGNTVAIGAMGPSGTNATGLNNLAYAGAVYIFSKDQGGVSNWGQVKKMIASDRSVNSYFATSVSLSTTTLFVGAPGTSGFDASTSVPNAGALYTFNADQGGVNNWGERNKFYVSKHSTEYGYGYKVAIDGNYAVLGARIDPWDKNGNNPLFNAGSAYVLKNVNGTWKEIIKLQPSDRSPSDYFGGSVSINGDNVAVGAYHNKTDAFGLNTILGTGAAYIFNKDQGGVENWGQVKKIVASDRTYFDQFGWDVSLSNGKLVVAAPYNKTDANGLNTLSYSGAVYIFDKDQGGVENWGQIKKIVANDRAINNYFGGALSINNDDLLVSSSSSTDANGLNIITGTGAAYVFNKDEGGVNNWGQLKKIVASDRSVNDQFSSGVVSISGANIVIGAIGNQTDETGNNTLSNAGAAYIFNKDFGGANNWGQVKKIVANSRVASDRFGKSVSISANSIVIGSTNSLDGANANNLSFAGAAYIFNKDLGGVNNWGLVKKIVASDRTASNYFGNSAAISNNMIIVGAPSNNTNQIGAIPVFLSGSAYIYRDVCSSLPIATNNTSIATSQNTSSTNYSNANCNLVATVAQNGANPILGHTNANVWIENTQPSASNNQYVKRHYEITPANNANTATGFITLYFTQQDFDDFNATSAPLKLPTNSTDISGKASLLIEKRPGVSADNSGLPNSYTGAATTINPIDNDIIWNSIENRWEVSFATTGFSGFFVKTIPTLLSTKWLSVDGKLNNKKQATLLWVVEENDIANFIIEKGVDRNNFSSISELASKGNGTNSYTFIEPSILETKSYYRIKEIGKDGKFSYSDIIKLTNITNDINVYPNPVKNITTITGVKVGSKIVLTDVSGKILLQSIIQQNLFTLDMSPYINGVYFLKFDNGTTQKVIKN
jgi:hypothetical protein